jgi:hypothetical protein
MAAAQEAFASSRLVVGVHHSRANVVPNGIQQPIWAGRYETEKTFAPQGVSPNRRPS